MSKFANGLKLAAIAFALVLAGCETKPPAQPAPQAPAAITPAPQTSSIEPGSVQDFQTNVGDTVHFDYNKYDVLDQDKETLQKQASWLARYPAVRVQIQGNCDERGTEEYNIALGARRANAVKEFLISLGVSAERIDTISYGKDRPICSESSESCWAQNRRGVTTITAGASS
jgi:peptidoglycan-associated lipoprotein